MINVYAHHSGQRYNWGFSPETVQIDRLNWIETANRLNNMPMECIGKIEIVNLNDIDETDFYVG
jgi:hypothetical protein